MEVAIIRAAESFLLFRRPVQRNPKWRPGPGSLPGSIGLRGFLSEVDAAGAGQHARMDGPGGTLVAHVGQAVRVTGGDREQGEPPLDVQRDSDIESRQLVGDVTLQ